MIRRLLVGDPLSEFATRVEVVARKVFERREFRHYREHRDSVIDRVTAAYPGEIRSKIAEATMTVFELESRRDLWERGAGRRVQRFGITLLVIALLAVVVGTVIGLIPTATLATWLRVDPDGSWIARRKVELVVSLTVGAVAVATVGGAALARHRSRRRAMMAPVTEALRREERALETAVQEAIAAAVNDLLGPQGIVAFPTHAPRLVELDTSQVTPSETIEYVREFILEHESSAIGLAGPRGSGKSTVMRALRADPEMGLVTIIPSPVRYDAGEFLRLLLREIATVLAAFPPSRPVAGTFGRAAATVNSSLLLAAFFLGALLVVSSITIDPEMILNPVSVSGGLLMTFASILGMVKVIERLDGARVSPETLRARELLRDLRWEAERSSTVKGLVKAWSVAEGGAERTLKLRHRGHTHAGLAAELRGLLTLFAGGADGGRFVVCVDELDKIDTVEHLVEIVNELKDLFHVQHVHFVVTVSTDALESFERRGLSTRDAFDSAFDTIVHTAPLALDESLTVVTARAAGFAPLIAMFCHAWSGGLARDLLRAARVAVEQQRRAPEQALSVQQIVEHLVLTDLRTAIRASMRGLSPGAPQVSMLWELHQALEVPSPTVPDLAFTTPSLQALHAKARLGVSLVRLARVAHRLPRFWDEGSAALTALRRHITEHADAMGNIDAQPPIRDAALAVALREVDPTVLEVA